MRFREIAPIFVYDEMQCLKASSTTFRDTSEFEIYISIAKHFKKDTTCVNNDKYWKPNFSFCEWERLLNILRGKFSFKHHGVEGALRNDPECSKLFFLAGECYFIPLYPMSSNENQTCFMNIWLV